LTQNKTIQYSRNNILFRKI